MKGKSCQCSSRNCSLPHRTLKITYCFFKIQFLLWRWNSEQLSGKCKKNTVILTRESHSRHIWDHNESTGEVTTVSGLCGLHSFGPQNHLHTARDRAPGQLRLSLLNTHLKQTWCFSTHRILVFGWETFWVFPTTTVLVQYELSSNNMLLVWKQRSSNWEFAGNKYYQYITTTHHITKIFFAYLLEVDKARLIGVQHEPSAVGAHRVLTDGGLRVFELLLYIFNDRLAVKAEESTAHQLRVNRVCTHHLSADTQQSADTYSWKLTDPAEKEYKQQSKPIF